MGNETTSNQSSTNRGLKQINVRNINYELQKLYRRFTVALNNVTGNDIVDFNQVRRIQDVDGIPIPYDKGKIVIRNGLDKLDYLLNHYQQIGAAIGVDPSNIWTDKRDFGITSENLKKMDVSFDLGYPDQDMQIYISKKDKNIEELDYDQSWVDYMMTQSWIDRLAKSVIGEWSGSDYRINYLSDMMGRMMKEHELGGHKGLDSFDGSPFMDKPMIEGETDKNNLLKARYIDAVNRLRSFEVLQYGFYELFKPLGGTTEKYVKVKVSTDGTIDISGVIGIDDCEHVDWEYGSMDYLRSLNTDDQRYDFKLSIPFNDENSILWWRPDNPERLEVDEEQEGEITEPTGYRYYKPYETERFLRWLGTNFVPMIDLDKITRQTVCQSPTLSDDITSSKFHEDATNIAEMNTSRASVDTTTSQSLLQMRPRACMRIINKADPPGQYAMFVVSGHQRTQTLSFHVEGKMLDVVQNMNHYAYTWNLFKGAYVGIGKSIMFLELEHKLYSGVIDQVWDASQPNKWIPDEWYVIFDRLKELQKPNAIDLLRMRQIDLELICNGIMEEFDKRIEFLKNSREKRDVIKGYLSQFVSVESVLEELTTRLSQPIYSEPLYEYIVNFKDKNSPVDLAHYMHSISLTNKEKEDDLKAPLLSLLNLDLDEDEQEELARYDISFQDVTSDELRETIETLNNLIVRLPSNSYRNNMISRHIFLDWKMFVDGAIQAMVKRGEARAEYDADGNEIDADKKLYVVRDENDRSKWFKQKTWGTDGMEHEYTELFTDRTLHERLVDYDYITYQDDGEGHMVASHDRWDFWTIDDFR